MKNLKGGCLALIDILYLYQICTIIIVLHNYGFTNTVSSVMKQLSVPKITENALVIFRGGQFTVKNSAVVGLQGIKNVLCKGSGCVYLKICVIIKMF